MDGAFATTVAILGETWSITLGTSKTHPYLKKVDGYCDHSIREIVVKKQREEAKPREQQNLRGYERLVLRHEIIHAFLYESGLAHNSAGSGSWAMNEEMIDWIARQHTKLHRAFAAAGACEEA